MPAGPVPGRQQREWHQDTEEETWCEPRPDNLNEQNGWKTRADDDPHAGAERDVEGLG